ncbi:MAG TPA: trigger factor [Gemmatimonadaceae bacterium]|nr:trigger factor [Gemmatimonadaceae bacterium]
MDIQITTKKSEGVERLLEVTVPAETVRAAEERTASRYASQVRLPGFRPGKAPTAVVKKRFKDAIRQQVLETLVQDAFKEVMEREQLKVASQPHVHDLKFDEGQPLTFELHVEVRPEIALNRLEGFRVRKPPAEVTDEQLEEQIEQIREQRATWAPSDDKPMAGDMVTVELATADDEGVIPEGKEFRLVLGEGQAIPGIEELVMELSPGETLERPVRWPDDFPDETQRGATKPVRVTLKEAKRKVLPALDDAFAREVGDFDSLDLLRQRVREDMQNHAQRDADASVRQQLLDQVAEANPFEVPPSWVTQMIGAYLQGYGIPEDQRDQFADQFRPIAERQVRRDLIVESIAEREKLAATESDIDDRVAEMAQQRGVDPAQVYTQLQKAGRLKEIEHGLTEERVFNWLLERNTVE